MPLPENRLKRLELGQSSFQTAIVFDNCSALLEGSNLGICRIEGQDYLRRMRRMLRIPSRHCVTLARRRRTLRIAERFHDRVD